MVVSMTGFGRSKVYSTNFSVTAEVKTVNHRFREYNIRMPRQLLKIEEKIKKKLGEYIYRGRVEVYITLEGEGFINRKVHIDWNLLDDYYRALMKIKEKYQLDELISIQDLVTKDEFISIEEEDTGNEELEDLVLNAIEEAAQQLIEMRYIEGNELEKDIRKQLQQFEQHIHQLETYFPSVVNQYKERLYKKIEDILSGQVDETRILTEVAIFADKVDINEELKRLQSHLGQFKHTIALNDPIGRKLDFLLQEMNREVNTIGSKANDSFIGKQVVDLKSLLEKMKEQVQNIE